MLDKIKEELKIKNNINNVKEDIKKLWKLLNPTKFNTSPPAGSAATTDAWLLSIFGSIKNVFIIFK